MKKILLALIFCIPNISFGATVVSQNTGTLTTPVRSNTEIGYPSYVITSGAVFDRVDAYVASNQPDSTVVKFQGRNTGGTLVDCETPSKTLAEWGIYANSGYSIGEFNLVSITGFSGTQCNVGDGTSLVFQVRSDIATANLKFLASSNSPVRGWQITYAPEEPEPTYGPTAAITDITTTFTGAGALLAVVFGSILVGLVGLFGIGYGVRKLIMYITGPSWDRSGTIGGFYYARTPYKGYNRWRSKEWNMEHTA